MSDAKHPIWALLRLIVMMSSLTVLLWFNASDFDATELRTLVGMFVLGSGTEGVSHLLRGKA